MNRFMISMIGMMFLFTTSVFAQTPTTPSVKGSTASAQTSTVDAKEKKDSTKQKVTKNAQKPKAGVSKLPVVVK